MRIAVGDTMPCGCAAAGNAVVIGIDRQQVKGVCMVDTDTGALWVRRYALDPDLRGWNRADIEEVEAPFELHCRNHPAPSDAWRDYSTTISTGCFCARHQHVIAGPGSACDLCVTEATP